MKFTPEEINNIISLKGANGKQIDIFDLHGVLFVGNSKNGTWDITKTYTRFSEHSLGICIEDFEDCQTEEEVNEVFMEQLKEIVTQKLI